MLKIVKRIVVVGAIGLGSIVAALVAYYFAYRPSVDIREFQTIQVASSYAGSELRRASMGDSPKNIRVAAKKKHHATLEALADSCLDVAKNHPQTTGEFAAIIWASGNASNSPAGHEALQLLRARVATADLSEMRHAVNLAGNLSRVHQQLAPNLLQRLSDSPKHTDAGYLLAQICGMTKGEIDSEQPNEYFTEAANLLVEQHAHLPGIERFCEHLGMFNQSPSWALAYEPHLRVILAKNRDRAVRCSAAMALASVIQLSGNERDDEVVQLYQQFVDDFDGEHKYRFRNIERQCLHLAKIRLADLRVHAVGNVATDIVGSDVDGQKMKLSDYHGKVVLLSFWATWCAPCMQLIPHERELVSRLADDQFAIVGVNGDTNEDAIRRVTVDQEITWRSFRDDSTDGPSISETWQVTGWPKLYLIDREGVIRNRWIHTPSPEELNREVDRLITGSKIRP